VQGKEGEKLKYKFQEVDKGKVKKKFDENLAQRCIVIFAISAR